MSARNNCERCGKHISNRPRGKLIMDNRENMNDTKQDMITFVLCNKCLGIIKNDLEKFIDGRKEKKQ